MLKDKENTSLAVKLAVLILTGYFLITGLGLYRQQLKNQAINGCLQFAGQTETTNDTGKYSYPNKDIYTTCLRDKGYTTSW